MSSREKGRKNYYRALDSRWEMDPLTSRRNTWRWTTPYRQTGACVYALKYKKSIGNAVTITRSYTQKQHCTIFSNTYKGVCCWQQSIRCRKAPRILVQIESHIDSPSSRNTWNCDKGMKLGVIRFSSREKNNNFAILYKIVLPTT